MEIYERIKLITDAYKHLNGHIRYFNEPMQSDTPDVKVRVNGYLVNVVGVAFNDLINGNLSMTINHPKFGYTYRVCLKLHITHGDHKLVWHDEFVKKHAEDALGVGVTPEMVLDAIQETVATALSKFVDNIYKDWKKIS